MAVVSPPLRPPSSFRPFSWWQGGGELGQPGLHSGVPGGGDLSVLVQFVEFAAQPIPSVRAQRRHSEIDTGGADGPDVAGCVFISKMDRWPTSKLVGEPEDEPKGD